MTMRCMFRWTEALGVSVALLLLVGCGGGQSYQVAEVDGVLTINGQPAADVYVQFVPNVAGDVSPPSSAGQTDAEGHFTLTVREKRGGSQPGAVVGPHRVVLRDLQLAKSATAAGKTLRMSPDYALAGRTPLREEVKEGKQTIDIDLPPYQMHRR